MQGPYLDADLKFLLVNEMRLLYDEESHVKHFLMNWVIFDFLLSKVGPHLLHTGTHEVSISAKERLTRYCCCQLASFDAISLHELFALSTSEIF